MKTKIVIATGGFDPIHEGHIKYLEQASKLGDYLIVGLNSDEWLARKKQKSFLSMKTRYAIVSNLAMVDAVWQIDPVDDKDDTCINVIQKAIDSFDDNYEIIFANGGDRETYNTPELLAFKDNPRVKFVFSVGGSNKENSSSWLLDAWRSNHSVVSRPWGKWCVVKETPRVKVKELIINPTSCLSIQRHFLRDEHWFVVSGQVHIKLLKEEHSQTQEVTLNPGESLVIERETWHTVCNYSDEECIVIEVQMGERCVEEDIERRVT